MPKGLTGERAADVLEALFVGEDWHRDWHRLRSSQKDIVLEEAERAGYRKPHLASGSRGRYFFEQMIRRASPFLWDRYVVQKIGPQFVMRPRRVR